MGIVAHTRRGGRQARRRGLWFLAAVITAVAAPGSALAANADFVRQDPPEEVGDMPSAIAAGEFNGDANQDLAVTNQGDDDVSILLGDGAGDFGTPTDFAVGDGPSAVAVGDFDGDSDSDLAVANRNADTVTILLGDGAGSFTSAGTESVGDQPVSIAVGLFNAGGDQDLAVANRGTTTPGTGTVSILLGDGTGNFNAAGTSPEITGGALTSWVVAGQIDAASGIDLAVANVGTNNISIMLGDNTGNFTQPATSPEPLGPGGSPSSLALDTFNADALPDLAASSVLSNTVRVLANLGAGNFTTIGAPPTEAQPTSIVAADFEGDADEDLATSNSVSGDVTVLTGNGAGTFTEPPTSPEIAGEDPVALAAASLDGDGTQDLAVTNFDSDEVSILLNSGTGVPSADVALQMADFPDPVLVGQTLTYTIVVSNEGDDTATGVQITDNLPGSVDFQSVSPTPACSEAAGTVTCNVGTLDREENFTATIKATPTSGQNLNNTATVSAATPDPDNGNDSETENTKVKVFHGKCNGQDADIVGTDGFDRLNGGPNKDVIVGLGGSDVIRGRGGNDVVCGGEGFDKLKGNSGNDEVYGQLGSDTLLGGTGVDLCEGGRGPDERRGCELP